MDASCQLWDNVCNSAPYFCIGICIGRIRVPYPFQWGAPSFDAGEAFAMMVTSFVALVEVCLQFTSDRNGCCRRYYVGCY